MSTAANTAHRIDRNRQALTQFHAPCTCGADVPVEGWDEHDGGEHSARVACREAWVAAGRPANHPYQTARQWR